MRSAADIEEWVPAGPRGKQDPSELAGALHATVHADSGASVSLVLPFTTGDARAFWVIKCGRQWNAAIRRVLVARLDGEIAGAVQLILDTPPNQGHRAEVSSQACVAIFTLAKRAGVGSWRRRVIVLRASG